MSIAQAQTSIAGHNVVPHDEWLKARTGLLQHEKQLTHAGDEVTRLRLELPWERVEKDYTFEGPNGKVSLADLFEGRSQLIVYHFMYGPGWEEGCSGCSFLADHIDGARLHLNHHDVTVAVVSRAPYAEFQGFKQRMGWKFPWYSSYSSDFNFDYGVSFHKEDLEAGPVFLNFQMQKISGQEQPGTSVFYKAGDGEIYHTYSSYERGGETLIGAYHFLDIAPLGRNEKTPMDWMRLHDRYDEEQPKVELADPTFVTKPPILIAGLEKLYSCENMADIPKLWNEFGPMIGNIPGQVGMAAYGVSNFMFDGGEKFRYMAACEVSEAANLPGSFTAHRLPAQKYAVFAHRMHVSLIGATVGAIWSQWVPTSGQTLSYSPSFIEYYNEDFDPGNPVGNVEIWVPVQ